MSERPQSPFTDRAIRESLADRDAPVQLTRSISDYAHATTQQSAPGVLGWSFPRYLFGGQRLVFAIVVIGLLVALGVAALLVPGRRVYPSSPPPLPRWSRRLPLRRTCRRLVGAMSLTRLASTSTEWAPIWMACWSL